MKKLSTLCVFALPMLLTAQEVTQDSVRRLDEFVVTVARSKRPVAVSKIEAPLKQIPITVNSITAEDLRVKAYNDAVEALREVPGVHSYRQYGAFHMFFIRGFYESLLINDGMRDERHAIWQSAPITGLGSIERIEVLKGAASMQQGHSAVGGVVNLVRKQPQAELDAYARLSYGSYNTLRVNAGATKALTDKLLLRADVEAVRSDGWRENYTKGYNASVVGKYLLGSRSHLQLSLYANKDNYGGDYGIPRYTQNAYRVSDNSLFAKAGEQHPQLTRKVVHGFAQDDLGHQNLSAQLRYEYRFANGWRLSEQLFASLDDIRYMSTDFYSWVTSDTPSASLPYYFNDGVSKKYTDLNTLERGGFAFDYDTRSLQNQLELSGTVRHSGGLEHNLLLGYNYLNMGMTRYDRASMTGEGYTKHITLLNPIRNQGPMSWEFSRQQRYADQTHGFYAQDYAKWGRFALLAGLRLDYFRRDFSVADTKGKTVVRDNGTQSLSNLALTYRAGLVYNLTSDINFYASASSFYKPQKVALSSEVAYLDSEGNEMGASELSKLPPMRGEQFELGSHLSLGDNLSLDASLFYLTLSNKLNSYLGRLDNGKRRGALVDGYESKGFELSGEYRPLEWLGLQLSYAYTDARVQAGKGAVAQYTSNSGNAVEHSPKHKLTTWLFGKHQLARYSRLSYGLGLEASSGFYTSESNQYRMPGYAILNAMASYQWSKWTLQLNVANLLDRDYTRHVLYDFQYIPSEGRNFTVSIAYRL